MKTQTIKIHKEPKDINDYAFSLSYMIKNEVPNSIIKNYVENFLPVMINRKISREFEINQLKAKCTQGQREILENFIGDVVYSYSDTEVNSTFSDYLSNPKKYYKSLN